MPADSIVALVRNTQIATDLGVEVREFDYTKPGTLVHSLHGIDKLLLISGNQIGQRLTQHKAVIDAAKQAGVKQIVYTSILHADSSLHVIISSRAPGHGTSHKASGLVYTFLRNGWYTENYAGS